MPDTSQLPLGGDLLLYNSDYQVLICRECEYAVQPAAISGHIKQHHKIYRKDRDDILEIVQQFPLVDPADLQYPDLAPQIPCLTVLRGLYCTAKKCTYLCASLKRMQQHWATSHDRTGRPDVDWKPTLMQTFFRGGCCSYRRRMRVRCAYTTNRYMHTLLPCPRRRRPRQNARPKKCS